MPAPTGFGSDRNSLRNNFGGVEIILMLEPESVPYFTMRLRLDEGPFLALENVGTRRTHNELDTS